MKTLGLTGGIASGKSTVAEIFRGQGIPVIDADQVARDLRKPGTSGHAFLLETFGTDDSRQIRETVFKSPALKLKLESYFHPLIRKESIERLEELKLTHSSAPFSLYEASLLIETGRSLDFDGVILVSTPPKRQIELLMKRDALTPESAQAILNAQLSTDEKKKYARYWIKNDSTFEELRQKVIMLHARIIAELGRN